MVINKHLRLIDGDGKAGQAREEDRAAACSATFQLSKRSLYLALALSLSLSLSLSTYSILGLSVVYGVCV